MSYSAIDGGSTGPEPVAHDPDPAEAAEIGEELARLLGLLGDEVERRVAVLKLQGHTNAEIAPLVGKSVATVERKLALIRSAWRDESANG